jgi:hypothetical protein
MDTNLNPTDKQRQFLERHLLGEEATILTLKLVKNDRRGFAVNVRGPFKLVQYKFPSHTETVLDASWAGDPESLSHLHCCWSEVRYAKLSPTTARVRESIQYQWQLAFFASEAEARAYEPNDPATDSRVFCFYLADANHKGVQTLKQGEVLAVTCPRTMQGTYHAHLASGGQRK